MSNKLESNKGHTPIDCTKAGDIVTDGEDHYIIVMFRYGADMDELTYYLLANLETGGYFSYPFINLPKFLDNHPQFTVLPFGAQITLTHQVIPD